MVPARPVVDVDVLPEDPASGPPRSSTVVGELERGADDPGAVEAVPSSWPPAGEVATVPRVVGTVDGSAVVAGRGSGERGVVVVVVRTGGMTTSGAGRVLTDRAAVYATEALRTTAPNAAATARAERPARLVRRRAAVAIRGSVEQVAGGRHRTLVVVPPHDRRDGQCTAVPSHRGPAPRAAETRVRRRAAVPARRCG